MQFFSKFCFEFCGFQWKSKAKYISYTQIYIISDLKNTPNYETCYQLYLQSNNR